MVIRPDVVYDAYNSIDKEILKNSRIIYLTPKGKVLTQEKVKNLSKEKNIILLCGHYEGIDQRVLDKLEVEEISVGDYILTGGEIPAMIVIDAVSRNVEGVISKDSLEEESFSNNAAISLFKLLKEDNISLILPIIYVKNTLLLITSYQEKEVEIQNRIQEKLGHIGISGFEMSLVGNEKGEEVLKEAIFRISRYKRILINFYNSDKFMEVGNTFFLTASGMAKNLKK